MLFVLPCCLSVRVIPVLSSRLDCAVNVLLPLLQHGFKETGVVNIAEPVMFELKGDEDKKEMQQSTKGVGNLLNMDTFSTLHNLRNKLSRFVLSSPTWLDYAPEPRVVQCNAVRAPEHLPGVCAVSRGNSQVAVCACSRDWVCVRLAMFCRT